MSENALPKRSSLRRKLLLAILGLLLAGFSFAILGTYIFLTYSEYEFYSVLSPQAREAVEEDWLETGTPPPDVLEEIALAHETFLFPAYDNEFWVFTGLSAIFLLAGSIFAWRLSKRLTAPLEAASSSAQIIASGDFAHKMPVTETASAEIASLAESFQHLSHSLQKMEDNVRATSASVAHELRTPLTVIQGYIQGIQDGVFAADAQQLDLVLGQVEGLSRLVDDLKLISLAETKALVLHPEETDLNSCIQEAVSFMQPQFSQAARTLSFQPSPETLDVFVDPDRIKQALIALMSNTFRYGGDGASCILSCARQNGQITITVSDTGPGFSKEALSNASDRFWRADASRARASGGSGLGLAVVRAIVEAHGGTLALSNSPGGGAVVALIFSDGSA
ncbi:MAG: ATP-binding protein [Pseudomonadota bacterium]